MDYTPVTFSTERRRTTVGHELALSVVFESGLQHFADSMETYSAYPLAETFLKWVPVTWDETVFLGGEPGSSVAIARRSNKNWFVGVLSAGPARTIRVDLNFIDDQHEATLIRDDDEGESFVCDEFSIGSGEQLSVSVPDDGGWVARLMPRTTS